MKRSKGFLASLLVLSILFLAACSDISPQPAQGLGEENASELSGFALDSQERLLAMMPGSTGMSALAGPSSTLPKQLARLLPQRGLSALSTEEDECITFAGDLTDADADEIPVDATITLNCTYSEDGSDFIVKGSARFQDDNDEDVLSGYTIEFVDLIITEMKDGKTNTLELDQTFVLSIDKDKNVYTIENDLVLHAKTPEGDFAYSELATLSYTPDDVSAPFAAGTFALNSVTTWQSGEDVYKLTGVSPALHYSASCESSFDKGTLELKDNFGNTLNLTYNACNKITIIYNGSPL